jgi:hypothetical protein
MSTNESGEGDRQLGANSNQLHKESSKEAAKRRLQRVKQGAIEIGKSRSTVALFQNTQLVN